MSMIKCEILKSNNEDELWNAFEEVCSRIAAFKATKKKIYLYVTIAGRIWKKMWLGIHYTLFCISLEYRRLMTKRMPIACGDALYTIL